LIHLIDLISITICHKHVCKAIKISDYIKIKLYILCLILDPETRDIWLEIHKLPRENWVTELENIKAKLQKKEEPPKVSNIIMKVAICKMFYLIHRKI